MPLVQAAQGGDRDAYAELYRRFGRFVYAVLLARVSHDTACDLAQDVFLQGWMRIASLRDAAAFVGWLGAIARRKATDHLRRSPSEVELQDRHASREAPDVTFEAGRAMAAIRELPEAYRETLALRLVEGYSGAEIAALTGLTPESVRVNLHRGFKLLRERLGGHP